MIEIQSVSKQYPNSKKPAVTNVSLTIQPGETLVLLGSSGSGKTTLMKMINRLIEPSQGDILIDDESIKDFPKRTLRRKIGYVFQQLGLFPHMSIEKNISLPLKLLRQGKLEQKKRTKELLHLIGLDPRQFAKRYPHELSGGQQQRVAVARALAADPNILLMDEPFAALDAIKRDELQEEILNLTKELNKTIIFVTHDLLEAFRIADRIGVMHEGHLEQVGTAKELITTPKTNFVKNLIDKPLSQLKRLTEYL